MLPGYAINSPFAFLRNRLYFFGSTQASVANTIMAFDSAVMSIATVGQFPDPYAAPGSAFAAVYPTTGTVFLLGNFAGGRPAYLFS